jgi:phenylacetate-CoA ligase
MMESGQLDSLMETLGREALGQIQLRKFQLMLDQVLVSNAFYRKKLGAAGITKSAQLKSFDDFHKLPFTTKKELSADQIDHPPDGTNLTFPRERYVRTHQTSGTTGEPLRCLDTVESWNWWARCWASVYRSVGVTAVDRIFFAFSFGPFIGFWSGYEGAQLIGALAIPGGGMSSFQRLKAIIANEITVLVCTPTYALHLAEVADQEGIDLPGSSVNVTIHAGEPGASLPSTRKRIEDAWGARTFDHVGATEVGAWGFECQSQSGIHVNEGEFIAEVIDPVTLQPATEGELVITNLGRQGMPVVRYRSGDRVKWDTSPCECGRTFARLEGGVIGRVDDVIIIRGVNIFPSAIENIVRSFPDIGEFAVDVHRHHELDDMKIRIEVSSDNASEVAEDVSKAIRNAVGIRARVDAVPFGSLPRFDLKARRITDHRPKE